MVGNFGEVPQNAQLADESAIKQILALHCRAVDRAEEAALKYCYWPEATVSYSAEPVAAHDFAASLLSAIKQYAATQHMIGNVLIEFDDPAMRSTARVETYLTAYHFLADGNECDSEMTYLGRYLDWFEKRGDVWKILKRVPVMSWSQNVPASHNDAHTALSALTRASRYPDDIVYTR
ncbi:nuclear transport factor 2 family protein [Parasphingorhabdus sp.]|uniref:nuclear transport factor 2 family protein n=1 Tax=Parasphingorhabdus sp. TaxID=2709688 RepID=UPI003267A084